MTTLEKRAPKGTLQVAAYDDASYPGFTLYLDGQQIAVFEYNSAKDALELHVWVPGGFGNRGACSMTPTTPPEVIGPIQAEGADIAPPSALAREFAEAKQGSQHPARLPRRLARVL